MNKLIIDNNIEASDIVIDTDSDLIVDLSNTSKSLTIHVMQGVCVRGFITTFSTSNNIKYLIDDNCNIIINKLAVDSSDNITINLNDKDSKIDYHTSVINYDNNDYRQELNHNSSNTESKIINHCINVEDLYITGIEQSGLQHLAYMFSNCTQLVHSPIKSFPKQIWQYCYNGLFEGCTNLIDCPELPAETLANLCYSRMLNKTKITWVKMLATDISANNCLQIWLGSVPNVSTSVFVKHIDAQWTNTGDSGVPTNWTVIYYDPTLDKYYLDQQRQTECDDHGNPI